MVGDVLECLGDLDSIFSLPGGDKMLSVVGVSLRKLGRTSTRGLLQVKAVFSAKSEDGTEV